MVFYYLRQYECYPQGWFSALGNDLEWETSLLATITILHVQAFIV
jgi:hypothetical protein